MQKLGYQPSSDKPKDLNSIKTLPEHNIN